MLCSRCKKRQAVVFVTGGVDGKPMGTSGFCMTCAREMGIPQVDSIMRQFGLDDDSAREMEDQLAEMVKDGGSPFPFLQGLENAFDDDEDEDFDDDDCEFESGSDEISEPNEDDKSKSMPGFARISSEDIDDEDDDDDAPGGFLGKLFGNSFQFGGATYQDDAKKPKKERRSKEKKLRFLGTYCTHLTKLAKEGKVDRIIGREREIERIVQILSRRQKNNPCLIGEPGVGKTAIAEGLALRIANGDVPPRLADKELYLMDLTALIAGTQFRGQFESRMKGLIDEVKSQGNIILFIDEVHTLVGTGDSEGSMNAANIMKPALSRGELQVIGATTFTEYRKHIEKDAALERRFQPVKVDEPSVSDTVAMLNGIKEYYEEHHGAQVSDAIVARAVTLSERYITDRFLPDKAIDLLDEASACAALRNTAKGELYKIEKELARCIHQLEKLEEPDEVDEPGAEPDYARIASLKSDVLKLEAQANGLRDKANDAPVTEADLAKVIELWTGIQASRVEESEFSRLTSLSGNIKKKIKGQDEAVDMVAAAIRRGRVQISPRRRPSSFIFVGPTGVGKTELVKVLANELFDSPETLIRLDMSEFMEKHSVSKMIGSPPGYVGYDEAGQLTEKVRRKPYSVLLFDEIEKAHPDVLNILLQILDEGRISDSQGRTVNFENTVIVMTSNAGSASKEGAMGFGKSEYDLTREKAMKSLSDFLRPEFLARVDEIVIFNPFSDDDFAAIARLMTDEYGSSLLEKGSKLIVTDDAITYICDKAKGGKSAARDLRNLIRRDIEDRLASLIIDREGLVPETITVDVDSEQLVVRSEE